MTRSKQRSKAKRRKGMKFKKPAIERAKQKAKEIKRMSKEELKKFKTLLLREREQAGGDLSHIADSTLNKSARDASGDLSGYSYHMADQATDDYDRDFSLERATAEQRLLYSIDEALKRIDEGTYGNCLFCGTRISKRRLTALPHSECCIDCQKSKENK